MKVNIGNYPQWIGPYQIAEAVFFWVDKYPELKYETKAEIKAYENRWDYKAKEWLGEFLAHGFQKRDPLDFSFGDSRKITWFYKLLSWIHSKQKQKVKIKIDPWDSWNCDSTLSPIILPLLKQLRETKHGSGYIELEDVPEHLRYTTTEEYSDQLCFEFYHEKDVVKQECDVHTRYNWVLNEIIWTFEQLQPDYDWEEQYRSGNLDFHSIPCEWDEDGKPLMYKLEHGPNDTYKCDYKATAEHQKRINNGLRLFGKYYQTFWD